VLPKLDYGNATPIGLPACQYDRLQSVLNAAARSIAGLRCSDHITDTLASFHWLPAPQRVQFKLAVLTFRTLHGLAPDYLSSELRRIADIPTRRRLWSAASGRLEIPPTHLKTVGDRAFSVAGLIFGTVCLTISSTVSRSRPSAGSLKPIFLNNHTLILFFSFFSFSLL
jgi:hypothetical protein